MTHPSMRVILLLPDNIATAEPNENPNSNDTHMISMVYTESITYSALIANIQISEIENTICKIEIIMTPTDFPNNIIPIVANTFFSCLNIPIQMHLLKYEIGGVATEIFVNSKVIVVNAKEPPILMVPIIIIAAWSALWQLMLTIASLSKLTQINE